MASKPVPFRPLIRFSTVPPPVPDPFGWRAAGWERERPSSAFQRDEERRTALAPMGAAGVSVLLAVVWFWAFSHSVLRQHVFPMEAITSGLTVFAWAMPITWICAWKARRRWLAMAWVDPGHIPVATTPNAQAYLAAVQASGVPLMKGDLAILAAGKGLPTASA